MNVVFLGAANPETARMITAVERSNPNFHACGFLDNDPAKKGTTFLGLPVFGGFEALDDLLRREDVHFVNLITGSTRVRYETSREMARRGCRFTNFVHPGIDLTMTELGVGNYIQEGVILQADVRVGNNSSIHMASLISHEVAIGDSVFVAHGVSISGCVSVGDGAFIGTHSTIIPRLRIGRWATVGAGAVVIKDVPDYATVVGNPARVVKVSDPIHSDGNIFVGAAA